MVINDHTNTVTHANTYNGELKASYRPEVYTYPIKEKVVARKAETMIEVEVDEWPTWTTPAVSTVPAKKTRRTK